MLAVEKSGSSITKMVMVTGCVLGYTGQLASCGCASPQSVLG